MRREKEIFLQGFGVQIQLCTPDTAAIFSSFVLYAFVGVFPASHQI
jgi:hypothetical protein